jgi:hypothetical protein
LILREGYTVDLELYCITISRQSTQTKIGTIHYVGENLKSGKRGGDRPTGEASKYTDILRPLI